MKELLIALALTAGFETRQIRAITPMEDRKTFAWAILMVNGPAYSVHGWDGTRTIEHARRSLVELGAILTYDLGSDGLGPRWGRPTTGVRWATVEV